MKKLMLTVDLTEYSFKTTVKEREKKRQKRKEKKIELNQNKQIRMETSWS